MATRYNQSKEHSAEVLRAVVRHLEQHSACSNPISYSVWYEHASGMNAKLSQAIESCLKTQPVLGDKEMLKLYRDHIADPDHETMEEINSELQRVMSGVAANASTTGASAGTFGEQINRLAVALAQGDSHDLPALLSSAAAGASQMKGTTAALVRELRDGQLEIERLRADLSRARDEALLDPLTGVLNRKGFDARLAALMKAPATNGHSHSLVMIDIDHFKKVNDTHGHVIGDQIIRNLAELLRRGVNEGEGRVARFGGDEFAILLPATSVAEGAKLADTLRQQFGAIKIRDRRTKEVLMQLTISAGVAAMTPDEDPAHWIASADEALYRSKQAGRDRVTC